MGQILVQASVLLIMCIPNSSTGSKVCLCEDHVILNPAWINLYDSCMLEEVGQFHWLVCIK